MAKNEAKIKFVAETGEFNEEIKKSCNTMSELRAELKLNEQKMKTSEDAIGGLENKHRILSEQLEASKDKTEALSQKLNKAIEIYGEDSAEVSKLRTQLINAQAAEERIAQAIEQCNAELEDHKTAAAQAESATGKLTDTIKKQQSELEGLKKDYTEAVLQYGEASDEAKELESAISDLSSELKRNKDALSNAKSKADELDTSFESAGDSAEDAGGGFTVFKGIVADLASNAIQKAIGKLSEFIGYLKDLPTETRELRQDFATLTTSFEGMGYSTEVATETWKKLYAVFGEDDRAVETANHISKIARNQEELNQWVTITTGIWGTYQDSLPVEGLAEAANETIKTGQVTGVLADALNWGAEEGEKFGLKLKENIEFTELSSKELKALSDEEKAEYEARKAQYDAINEYNKALEESTAAEDIFNLALSECSTEQERKQLITETLTALYGDAAETYRDTAEAQMEAKEATADNIAVEAELAEMIEPVTTEFTELKTELLEAVAPAIETVSDLMLDALEWAREHPVAMQVLAGVIGTLATAFSILAIGLGIYATAQFIANTAFVGFVAPALLVVAAIAAIVAVIIVIINYTENITAFFDGLREKINAIDEAFEEWKISVCEKVSTWASNTVESIDNWVSNTRESFTSWADSVDAKVDDWKANVGEKISTWASDTKGKIVDWKTNTGEKISTWASDTKAKFSDWKSNLTSTFSDGLSSAYETASTKLGNIKDKFSSVFEDAKSIVSGAIEKIKGMFDFKWSLPHIDLPHFTVSGGKAPWGFGGKGSLPSVSVSWYEKGGFFPDETIIPANGFGEKDPEYALPLNRTTLTPLADLLGGMIMDRIKDINCIDYDMLEKILEKYSKKEYAVKMNRREFLRIIEER